MPSSSMQFEAPDVRIVDVETCDFGLMPSYDTETVLRNAMPGSWERYLHSAVARRLISDLGVVRRHLTHLPGRPPEAHRLTALDLACSAVNRLRRRRSAELQQLDALIFVSTSNPHPCNSQAALLAERLQLRASCFDLKAGCSGGVLGLLQAALLVGAGCQRVLVVMAENLSQLTPTNDLRMLLTVGDGAACILLERAPGPGFLAMLHGSEPALADAIAVRTPFPPAGPDARYLYDFQESCRIGVFIHEQWRSLFRDSLEAAQIRREELSHWFFHQTHGGQVEELWRDCGAPPHAKAGIVQTHGNMGTPTFAVAMARDFAGIAPGQKFLLQAVGGGVSWCAIVAEHR